MADEPSADERLAACERLFRSAKLSGQWEEWISETERPRQIPPWRPMAADIVRARLSLSGGDLATIAAAFFDQELRSLEWRLHELLLESESADPSDYHFRKIRRMIGGAPASGDPCSSLRVRFVEFVLNYLGAHDEPSSTTQPVNAGRTPLIPSSPSEREAAVDEFLSRCNRELPFKVAKGHISRAVKHDSPRQFQRWKAGAKEATAKDDENFRRILAMSPGEFHALLVRLGVKGVPAISD